MKYGCGRVFQNEVITILSHEMEKPPPQGAERHQGVRVTGARGATACRRVARIRFRPVGIGPAQREGIEPPT